MKTGIWIDKKEAIIVSLNHEDVRLNTISSEIEFFNVHGGSGTRLKGGPQDVVQDRKYLEREKHQTKRYFDAVIQDIESADAIVIFGPSEMGQKLHKEMELNHPLLAAKVAEVARADSMTENQMIAWVKSFFKSHRH
ncbi:hypothetical protein [Aestuariivivens sediminicola]|uniref:hypothetical protein n=1 Tax=Aestuariivivens sediminicola TaxID=2913560 RepID=UPI001F5939E9|nr:hypothetical protein [Aestuariivivens sediminicola]